MSAAPAISTVESFMDDLLGQHFNADGGSSAPSASSLKSAPEEPSEAKPSPKSQKSKTTTEELLEQRAREGEPGKVLQHMLDKDRCVDLEASLKALDRAVDAASGRGAAQLLEVAFVEALSFTIKLLLRGQYLAAIKVRPLDRAIGSRNCINFQSELNEQHLPAIQGLHEHLIALGSAYGRLQHALALGRRNPMAARQKSQEQTSNAD